MIEDLREFARHQFSLTARQPDGGTLLDHLQIAVEQGLDPPELRGPPCPDPVRHVWAWFSDLTTSRSSNGFGLGGLEPLQVLAWAHGSGIKLRPWEFQALRKLDRDYLAAQAAANRGGG